MSSSGLSAVPELAFLRCGFSAYAVEARLTHRNFIGVDINPAAIELTKTKCAFDFETQAIVTLTNDDALREKVARLWSELNGAEITPEMIHCEGCRADGAKTPYCDSLCPIRQCALGKAVETCGDCPAMNGCQTVGMVLSNNPEAAENLKNN